MYFIIDLLDLPVDAKVGSIRCQAAPSKKIAPSTQPDSSMLLHAGVSVADGLSLMAQGGRGEEKELLSTLARKMDDGAGLAEAFRRKL